MKLICTKEMFFTSNVLYILNLKLVLFLNHVPIESNAVNTPEQVLGGLERAAIWFDYYDTEWATISKNLNLFCQGKIAKEQKMGFANFAFYDHYCRN